MASEKSIDKDSTGNNLVNKIKGKIVELDIFQDIELAILFLSLIHI